MDANGQVLNLGKQEEQRHVRRAAEGGTPAEHKQRGDHEVLVRSVASI